MALRHWAERHEAGLAELLYYARTLDVEARVRRVFNDLHNMTRREGRSTAELRPYLLSERFPGLAASLADHVISLRTDMNPCR